MSRWETISITAHYTGQVWVQEQLPWAGLFDSFTGRAMHRLIGPMMPHLAEELWRTLGHETLLVDEDWPEADAELLVDDTVTVAVQVNGKLRATIELPLDAEDQAAQNQALAEPAVQRAMGEQAARKIIVVKNRVVNIVV